MMTTISELWVYPVKSLAGIRLPKAEITAEGLSYDRRWMLIDDKGNFISQRKVPSMGLISTEFTDSLPSDSITLKASSGDSCSISPSQCKQRLTVTVWKTPCDALLAPKNINDWLCHHIQYKSPLRLVYFDPCFRRPLNPTRFGPNTTAFADAAPILLTNNASLHALNSKLSVGEQSNSNNLPARNPSTQLEMQRFRPNIVIEGASAFEEHQFNSALTNNIKIKLVDHCQRCSIITLNPQTAKSDDATIIFNTLASLNSMPDNAKAPAFGVNCTFDSSSTRIIHEGASIELINT